MSRRRLSRRKFVAAAGTTSVVALAGCADGGDGNGAEDDEPEDNETEDGDTEDETYTLTVTVEDGDGEPVEGATVMVMEAGMMEDDGAGNETDTGEDNETDAGNETADNDTDAGNETDTEDGMDTEMEQETDEEGMVEFTELENGEYTVTAESDGQQAEDDVEIDGADEEVTLTLGEDGAGNETGDNETDNETDDGA